MQTKSSLFWKLFFQIPKKCSYTIVVIIMLIGYTQIAMAGKVKTASKQQQITVTGIVSDENGEPLPGASIRVQGSTRGVTTDLDGSFFIDVQVTDILEISFIGYETMLIAVENNRKIDVSLELRALELDDVTIVAFAKQKKESVIASISTITPSELKVPSSNL